LSAPAPPVLTGSHLVETVLRFGRTPPAELIVVRGGSSRGLARIVTLAGEKDVPVCWVDPGEQATDVALVLSERETLERDDVLPGNDVDVFLLAVEGVEDPHNLGDVLRTAWSAGVDGVVLEVHARAMPRDLLARSSAGASECLPILFTGDLANTLEALRARNVETVAATPAAETSVFDASLSERVVIVIGGEHRGLSAHVAGACNRHIAIPTAREVQSLSAVSSAAVMLFEVVRRRSDR